MATELCCDIKRPLNILQCGRGWETQREYNYSIPPSDIEGEIPKDLYGTLFRNGPGINAVYGKPLKHPIDGDGMVCALTFDNGSVHFKSKFVSSKHRQEETVKQELLYTGQMGTHPRGTLVTSLMAIRSLLTGQFPRIKFRNPSNTNVFLWGGKLLTCYETGIPYCLDPFTLETLGPETLGGNLHLGCLAAHFRIDPETWHLVCISLRPGFTQKESLAIYEFDTSWKLCQKQVHHIAELNYAHDFLLLPDYYIFHITPFVKSSAWIMIKILSGYSSPGEEMRYYPDLPSKFVIIPRKNNMGSKGIVFVETDPCHIFHFGTAQQKGDLIEFNAVCLDTNMDLTFDSKIWLSNSSVSPGRVFAYKIDLVTRQCTRNQVDRCSGEFPSVHPYRHGVQGSRYAYLMASDRPGFNLPYRDVVKFDASGSKRQVWYSHGCIGEPVFVPRNGYSSARSGDEDDGYVIVQLYVPEKHVTEFCVLDAKNLGLLARIKLKHHVPYGFHGTFTPQVFQRPFYAQSKL